MSTAARSRSRAFPAKRKTPTPSTTKSTSKSTSTLTSTTTSKNKKTRPVRTQHDDEDEDEDEDEDDDSAQHVDMIEDGDDDENALGDVEDGSDGSANESNDGDEILDDDDDISAPRNADADDGGIDEPDDAFDDEMEQGTTTFGATLAELLHQDLKQEDKPILGLKAHKLDELEMSQKQLKHEAKMKRMKTVEKKALLEKDHVAKPEFSEKERKLRQIATRGVVTLFNAVTKQQRSLRESEEEKSGVSKDSVSSLSKDGFLQLLKQESNHVQAAPSRKIGGKKDQHVDEEGDEKTTAPGWKALKEDYMMGGNKLKDWDKELSDDDEEEEEEEQGGGGDEGSEDD